MHKLSKHRKRILCALVGSTLALHSPFVAYAAEHETETAASEQNEGKKSEGNEFTFQKVTVTSEKEKKAEKEKTEEKEDAYAGGQVAKKANLGMLGSTDLLDIPFNMISYTSKVIEDQQARTLSDVLLNDPSVRFTTSSGHMNENYTIRGFDVTADDLSFNGLYGIVPSGHVPTEMIESVEVLKGPSALLNGTPPGGSVGGTINIITKKAEDKPITRVTTDYTSGSQLGLHLDLGRRFGEENEWGFRLNAVRREGGTGVSGQDKGRTLGALNLDYQGKRWRAYVDAYNDTEKFTGGSSMMVNFKDSITQIPAAPAGDINAFKGAYGSLSNKGAMFRSEYDFSKDLTAYASIGYLKNTYKGFINSTHARSTDALGNYSGYTTNINGYSDNVSAELGLRHTFNTGDVKHKMVLSATRVDTESGSAYTQSGKYSSNIYNPSVPILSADPANAPKTSSSTLTSIAIADTMSFVNDKYNLTLGVRNQQIESDNYSSTTGAVTSSYSKSAVTPAIAFVVKPWAKPISLYANYIEGLSKGSTVTDTTASNYGTTFAPFKTKQAEVGVKWENGSNVNTVSFYQIQKPSAIKNNVTNAYNEDGQQRNRGIEWASFGKVNENLSVLGGVTYMRGIQTHTLNGTNDGKTAYGTPTWQANVGFEYAVPKVQGLSFDTRAVYTGSQYINGDNTAKIPSWIRYDAGVQYKTQWQGNPTTFRFSVENLTNKNYWSGVFRENYLTVGNGRTYKVSMSIDL